MDKNRDSSNVPFNGSLIDLKSMGYSHTTLPINALPRFFDDVGKLAEQIPDDDPNREKLFSVLKLGRDYFKTGDFKSSQTVAKTILNIRTQIDVQS